MDIPSESPGTLASSEFLKEGGRCIISEFCNSRAPNISFPAEEQKPDYNAESPGDSEEVE